MVTGRGSPTCKSEDRKMLMVGNSILESMGSLMKYYRWKAKNEGLWSMVECLIMNGNKVDWKIGVWFEGFDIDERTLETKSEGLRTEKRRVDVNCRRRVAFDLIYMTLCASFFLLKTCTWKANTLPVKRIGKKKTIIFILSPSSINEMAIINPIWIEVNVCERTIFLI